MYRGVNAQWQLIIQKGFCVTGIACNRFVTDKTMRDSLEEKHYFTINRKGLKI